jgi:hypothetical protein
VSSALLPAAACRLTLKLKTCLGKIGRRRFLIDFFVLLQKVVMQLVECTQSELERDADGKWMHKKWCSVTTMHASIHLTAATTMRDISLALGISASLRRKRSPTRSFR